MTETLLWIFTVCTIRVILTFITHKPWSPNYAALAKDTFTAGISNSPAEFISLTVPGKLTGTWFSIAWAFSLALNTNITSLTLITICLSIHPTHWGINCRANCSVFARKSVAARGKSTNLSFIFYTYLTLLTMDIALVTVGQFF